ncbi:TPA: hypothetical protein ACS773_002080 [Providencia alcalifaciens]
MKNPKLIVKPFAKNGQKNVIPENYETSMDSNQATWDQGFGQITMLPVAAGGLPPKGQDFNGILNQISENIVYQSQGGRFKFSPEYAESIGGYPKGAILQSDDEKKEYQSLIDNNKVNFNAESNISASWELVGAKYAIKTEVDLALLKKFDKENISSTLGNDSSKVPSLGLLTIEVGKLQPKGNYQPAGDYATNTALTSGLAGKQPVGNYASGILFYKTNDYTGLRTDNLTYAAMMYNDGSFKAWDDAKRVTVWGFSNTGEMTNGLIPISCGGTGAKTASLARSNLSVFSKDEVNSALSGKQPVGNYASGDNFYSTASLSGMRTASKNYALVNFENGDMGGWDESTKSFTFRFDKLGKLTNGTVPASLVTGLAQIGVNQKTTNMLSQRAANTTYTNDTGVPILVSVSGTYAPGSGSSLVLVVDGQIIGGIAGGSTSNIPIFVSHIVPAGKDYRVNMAGTQTKIDNWTELR